MNLSKNSYSHIKSFEDFENEKIKLYFQIKLSEKKLQLKYIELTSFLNPVRFVPLLLNSWLTPIFLSLKNLITGFFRKDEPKCQATDSDTNNTESND